MREMRAMMLGALPYPPLPVEVGKVEDMQITGSTVTTTHTLIAQCVQVSMQKNDQAENERRQKRQKLVLQEFLRRLAEIGFLQDGHDLYRLYCEFSYKHIGTYFPEGFPLDLRFLPLEYIAVGDATHQKMVEHFNAQSVLFKEETIEDVQNLPAILILRKLRDKLGHAE